MEQTVHLMHLCARWGEMPVKCDFIATPTFAGFLGNAAAATAAKSLQLCPTLCNPIDGSPPGSPIPWIEGQGTRILNEHLFLTRHKVTCKRGLYITVSGAETNSWMRMLCSN